MEQNELAALMAIEARESIKCKEFKLARLFLSCNIQLPRRKVGMNTSHN